jgi:hypothetical protein
MSLSRVLFNKLQNNVPKSILKNKLPITVNAGLRSEPPPKKLLDRGRDAIRVKHYSSQTEKSAVQWIRRYILFH